MQSDTVWTISLPLINLYVTPRTIHSQWQQYCTLITCTKYIWMAQATRKESALQQFYKKEIMPSRPLDIISALASVIQYMKAEGVGVLMGLHLLNSLNRRLNGAVIMGSDSQALIKATKNWSPHAGH